MSGPLCLPGEGWWPWLALLALLAASWVAGWVHRRLTRPRVRYVAEVAS